MLVPWTPLAPPRRLAGEPDVRRARAPRRWPHAGGTSRSSTRPAAPTPTCSRRRGRARRTDRCWRRRHQTAGRGRLDRTVGRTRRRQPARLDAVPRRPPTHAHELTWRVGLAGVRRRARPCAGVSTGAEVAERPAARRPQAGRRAGPGGELGTIVRGRRHRAQRRLGAPKAQRCSGDDIDPLTVLAALLRGATTSCPPTSGRRTARTSPPSDATCASSCPAERTSAGGRSTSSATAGWWCVDECGITHRFDVGDVVHLR